MKIIVNLSILVSFLILSACQPKNLRLYQYVNPLVGTDAHGHTFPGATQPFGMVQLSPDTRLDGWDGCSGYHYSDSIIYGFSHTHLSGTGVSDYADLLMMPGIGKGYFQNGSKGQEGYSSKFSHKNEKAEAGYYKVLLDKHKITAELTSTLRCGFHKYSFPEKNNDPHIVIDLEHRDECMELSLAQNGQNEIIGSRRSRAWATDQHFYFVLQFSKPIVKIEFKKWDKDSSKNSKAIVYFENNSKEILSRVGISFVDIAGAKNNLSTEITDWDFNKMLEQARDNWDKALGKIEVEGGTKEQRHIFYTALYHTMIAPNTFSDVDGKYRSMNGKIVASNNRTTYTIFSLWDTFRATHPLYTLIERQKTLDFIKTFLSHYQEGGKLPVWELAANETNCMIGYHSVSVIADAFAKGIVEFDQKLALEAMLHSANLSSGGLKAYSEKGLIEMNDNPESVSKTLEYAYDDWCIANFAKSIGNDSVYNLFIKRAQSYKNIYDPKTGFMRAKINGGWFSPFSPSEVNFNYTEANSWQYSLFVPQDIDGLMKLMGGKKGLENYLDSLFTTSSNLAGHEQADITGLIGQYAHGNEPSHHKTYLYNFVGKPDKTQLRVRQIMEELYKNTADGLSGNEDCGQMSAWYVLSAMGIYAVTPGKDEYIIGSPIFDKVKINFENGKSFTITAKNNSKQNKYIQSAKLNGKDYPLSYLKHNDLLNGGEIIFEMGSKPGSWGTKSENCPKTAIPEEHSIVAVPFFISSSNAFSDSLKIEIAAPEKVKIKYWTTKENDLDNAVDYQKPITIKTNTTFFAFAENEKGQKSKIVMAYYPKADANRKITLKSKFADRYSGGGSTALIDGLEGGQDYRSGFWQGFQRQDLEFVVDLGAEKNVKYLALNCIQDAGSWIWFPRDVTFEISSDNKIFKTAGKAKNQTEDNTKEAITQRLAVKINSKTRYIKVKATNIGKCPSWHPGAGGDAWIFADELIVE